MGTRWPESCWATYKGEINIILKVTSSWSLYPHWTTMHGQPYIKMMALKLVRDRTISLNKLRNIRMSCRAVPPRNSGHAHVSSYETWTETTSNWPPPCFGINPKHEYIEGQKMIIDLLLLLLFCTMTNKRTIISQIITILLNVSTLSWLPQGVRS